MVRGCKHRFSDLELRHSGRDVSPQSGTVTAAGAATSAAVPSANDLEGDDTTIEQQSNGSASAS